MFFSECWNTNKTCERDWPSFEARDDEPHQEPGEATDRRSRAGAPRDRQVGQGLRHPQRGWSLDSSQEIRKRFLDGQAWHLAPVPPHATRQSPKQSWISTGLKSSI